MLKGFLLKIAGIIFGVSVVVAPVPHVAKPQATTTPVVVKTIAKTATSTKSIVKKPAQKQTEPTTKQVTETPIVPKPPEPTPDFEKINVLARSAIVNIFCTIGGDSTSPTSGTGVVITPDGLILTNAHIAQYFLLRDFRYKNYIECVIRTGSPAYPRYHAELVYISPTWIANNKTILKEQNPKGTGEYDYAFLRITDAIDGSPLPKLPYVPPDIREFITVGEPVLLASYPAGFLGGISINQNLSQTSAITSVQGLSTFDAGTIDLISVGGTVVSQKGSSGGAVVDKYSTLIGIISTEKEAPTTGERGLYAITPAYINRSLQSELGMTFRDFLAQDLPTFAKKFQTETAPLLTKLITDELNKR